MKLTAILILLAQGAAAQGDAGLNLADAVAQGLKSDNIVKQEAARIDGARAGLEQARLSRYGGLKVKGMYTDGNDPVYAFASSMKQGTFSMASMATINDPDPVRNYMAGVEAGVPVYTGGALKNAAKMGALGVEAATAGYERAQAGITFKVTYQWLTVLLREKLARLGEDTVKSAEEEMKTARMLLDKGMVPGADYYGAEAILATLKGYRLSWRMALLTEQQKLGAAVGQGGAVPAAGELAEAVYAPNGADTGARRDVKALDKMAEISRTQEDMQKNSVLPVVEAFGSWETNSESLSDFRDNRMLGLRLTLPIGDPTYYAKRDGAKAEAAMAKSRADEARKQAGVKLAEAHCNYQTALDSLPVAKETVDKARPSLELFRPLYRQGRQSVLEVLRAQAALMQAEAGYYETLYKLNLYHAQELLAAEALDAAAVKDMSAKLSK